MRVCAKSRGVLRTFVGTSPMFCSTGLALKSNRDGEGRAVARISQARVDSEEVGCTELVQAPIDNPALA